MDFRQRLGVNSRLVMLGLAFQVKNRREKGRFATAYKRDDLGRRSN